MTGQVATRQPSDRGFTLVEVLVSMFIFSLISVAALIALSTTLDAREASEARIEQTEALAAARRIMADDFGTMVLRQNRDGLGGFIDLSREAPRDDRFELTRRARPNPNGLYPRGDLLRVSYRVEDGALIRAFLPHENPAFVEPARDRVVLRGVRSLRVEPIFPHGAPLDGAPVGLSIRLTHADDTTTRHVFELAT